MGSQKIVELDWVVFDLNTALPISEHSFIINPGEPIQNETSRVTGVTQGKVNSEGITLEVAISKFEESIQSLQKVSVLTFGEW